MCQNPEIVAEELLDPARRIPVAGRFDVVVAGGGVAGTAAAVAAARQGASVALLEKESAPGGLATLGNVTMWLPICDGRGRQVIGGLGEELLKLSVADLRRDNPTARFTGIPECWSARGDREQRKKTRYQAEFNPASCLLALEKLLTDAGVRIWYDTRVCAARRDADRVTHLIVENKSGRSAVGCGAVVDATGDADICAFAGEQTESLDSNVLCGWFYRLQDGVLHQERLSHWFSSTGQKEGAVGPFFRGDNAEDVTAQLLGSRELIRRRLAALAARHPQADICPLMLPGIAGFRMTRRLVGAFSLGACHKHQWFDDTVGLTGDWREAGPVYALPLRILSGVANRNLLAAGRCVSVDTTLWDCTRAIPTCVVTGEAAGTAAGMAVQEHRSDVQTLPVAQLQERLRERGALLDPRLTAPCS